jgi:hypothetical protein
MRRLLALCFLVLSGSGGVTAAADPSRSPAAHVQVDGHITVDVPAGWDLATKLTALSQPLERFTLSSGPLPQGPQNGCGPRAAVARLDADDVLAFVVEWPKLPAHGGPNFPPRARALARLSGAPAEAECLGRGRIVMFRVDHRFFTVAVAVGSRAPAGRVDQLLGALRHMRVGSRA